MELQTFLAGLSMTLQKPQLTRTDTQACDLLGPFLVVAQQGLVLAHMFHSSEWAV